MVNLDDDMLQYQRFDTKDEMLNSLRAYLENPDDDTIRIKNKIKTLFSNSPKLLWSLNNADLESQLFNEDGTLNEDGEWDAYFGDTSNIRPYLFLPETQDIVCNYLCYQVSVDENMRYNSSMKYMVITFTILVHEKNSFDEQVGMARHDLIASIIRELMAWSGITTASAVPIYEGESVTDNNYITKVLRYQALLPNNLVVTDNVGTRFVNKTKR